MFKKEQQVQSKQELTLDTKPEEFLLEEVKPFLIYYTDKRIIILPSAVGQRLDIDLNNTKGSGGSFIQRVITFTDADTTPSVKNANVCITTGTTNITDFDDGILGQTIIIKATASITVENSAAVVLNGASNYAMTDTDTLTLTMFVDQVWTEVARSVN